MIGDKVLCHMLIVALSGAANSQAVESGNTETETFQASHAAASQMDLTVNPSWMLLHKRKATVRCR